VDNANQSFRIVIRRHKVVATEIQICIQQIFWSAVAAPKQGLPV
jgi:hypothetical protein